MFAIINVGRRCVRSISCPNIESFTSALMHHNGLNACALMGCRYVHNLLLDFAYTFTTGSATYTSLLIVMDTLALFIYTLGYSACMTRLRKVSSLLNYAVQIILYIIADKARPIIYIYILVA